MGSRGTIVESYTARNRRTIYKDREFAEPVPTRFTGAALKAAPAPRPAEPVGPFGDMSKASIAELCGLLKEAMPGHQYSFYEKHRRGLRMLLGHLETCSGESWQQRWESSGFDEKKAPPVNSLSARGVPSHGHELTSAAKVIFSVRAIVPSLSGFRSNRFNDYSGTFRVIQRDPVLDAFFEAVDADPHLKHTNKIRAKFDVTCALTIQGIRMEHLTPPALLHYSLENRTRGLTVGAANDQSRFAAVSAWEVLCRSGIFPPETPSTLRMFINDGQRSLEELVDRYDLRSQEVRQLIVDYLARRRPDMDYTSIESLARILAGNFWSKIEKINPGQKNLELSEDVYDQWRAEIMTWENEPTKVRRSFESILMGVRGFYVDLHSWAVQEPGRWGPWAATCPIKPEHLKGFARRRREINRRMAERTRERQPLLPALAAHAESEYEFLAGLLDAGGGVELGEHFEFQGQAFQRTKSREDQRLAKHGQASVRVRDEATGKLINVTVEEESAFFAWASVEILRHSGIRVEELCELTHTSIRQYQRPNGEVIALLVIAPSKTDRERVIPMSAELFHAVAQLVRRQTRRCSQVPLVSRYDGYEKTWSEPMSFLLQHQHGSTRVVYSTGTIEHMLRRYCRALAKSNLAFAGISFTPHDFRRLFATEIVNSGLPIHIGARLLGHLNLQTTRGYVAVFSEDVVTHYQQYLEHRRSLRPRVEYVEVTEKEWEEFEEHFDKRKVELGNCARPYGTACQHEHACIRCPVLQVNPKMLPRLREIEKDLVLRRKQAEDEQWLGEIDGIDKTLVFLQNKLAETERAMRRSVVDLAMPQVPHARTP